MHPPAVTPRSLAVRKQWRHPENPILWRQYRSSRQNLRTLLRARRASERWVSQPTDHRTVHPAPKSSMHSDSRGHHYWGNLRLSGDLVGLVRNVRARELENSLETLRRVLRDAKKTQTSSLPSSPSNLDGGGAGTQPHEEPCSSNVPGVELSLRSQRGTFRRV